MTKANSYEIRLSEQSNAGKSSVYKSTFTSGRSKTSLPALLPTPKIFDELPRKRLTLAEYETRKSKGLCFHCDEIYKKGHICKHLFSMHIVDITEEDDHFFQQQESEDDLPPSSEVSLHAMSGLHSQQTIRFTAHANRNQSKYYGIVGVPATSFNHEWCQF